jgi:hypothetical protein
MKKRLEEVIAQRDVAHSQLISAQRRVIELTFELQSVKEQLKNFQSVSTLKLQD